MICKFAVFNELLNTFECFCINELKKCVYDDIQQVESDVTTDLKEQVETIVTNEPVNTSELKDVENS